MFLDSFQQKMRTHTHTSTSRLPFISQEKKYYPVQSGLSANKQSFSQPSGQQLESQNFICLQLGCVVPSGTLGLRP